jgi:hypothetical protein
VAPTVPVAPDRIYEIYGVFPFGRFLVLALPNLGVSRSHVSLLRFGARPYSSGAHRPCSAKAITASSEGHRKVLRLQDSAQYPEWSRDMKHNITANNAWGIVLGDVKQSQKPEFDPIPTTDR